MSTADLKDAWLALWTRIGAEGGSEPPFDSLIARYSEEPRAYHSLAHIEHCLMELAQTRESDVDRDALEFAIWFHDAVYDTHAKDSEERSAALAREVARAAALPASFIDVVVRLILATRHTCSPTGLDEQLMVDIDLAILGQESARFDEYEQQIRVEYSWVPPAVYAEARVEILESFLARPSIYSTGSFQLKYEAIARENLARSIRQLKSC
jgi:predicted metal-dependent HD superfamily phosphohydrolase